MLEAVEPRSLFTSIIDLSFIRLTDGVLEVGGGQFADKIVVGSTKSAPEAAGGDLIYARVNANLKQSFRARDVKEIRIVGGDGDDSIRLRLTAGLLTTRPFGPDGDAYNLYPGPPARVDGGNGGDAIAGDAGNDILRGGAGNDTIYAGHGNDLVRGGDGDDALYSTSGRDTLFGEGGADAFFIAGGASKLDLQDDETAELGRDGVGLDFSSRRIVFRAFLPRSADNVLKDPVERPR